MRKLNFYLENPFDDATISLDELLAFSTDHLQRLIANNPASIFAARITATTTALNAVQASSTSDRTKLGVRQSRKAAKDAFRRALPANIAKIGGAITAKYGAKSGDERECFPQGRKVFGACADDKVTEHLQALINGLTARQAALGAPVVTDATALLTSWTAIYNSSESATGAKSTTESDKRNARAALQLELFKNLLTLALNFPGKPEQLGVYMQQTLLEDKPKAKKTAAATPTA